jgi:hypothetical protein
MNIALNNRRIAIALAGFAAGMASALLLAAA